MLARADLRAALPIIVLFRAMSSAAAEAPADRFLALHAETRGFMLGRPTHPSPTPDGKSVLFLRSGPKDTVMSLYEFDVATGHTRELLTPARLLHGADERLSPEERARRERMRVSTRGFTGFEVSRDGALLLVSLSGRLYVMHRSDGRIDELPTGDGAIVDPRLAPDGARVAYVRDRDLYVLDLGTRVETRLSRSTDPRRSAGLAEFVAQEEMARFSGYWWAPDGKRIACEEVDNTGVEEFHLADPAHPERGPDTFYYPRPGQKNARVSLSVITLPAPGKPPAARPVDWDHARLPYLSQASWRQGGPLTIVVRNREQTDARVLAWDETSGATRTLIEEHDPAWLHIDPTLPRWLPDGSGFLWSSDASGQRQLHLRAPDGKLVRVLSDAGVEYRAVRHVTSSVVVYVGGPDPTEQKLYQAGIAEGGGTAIDAAGAAIVDAVYTEGTDLHVVTRDQPRAMPASVVVAAHGGDARAGTLPSVALDPPFVPEVELTRAGPRDLRAVVVRPRGFAHGKKYPVIVDVYGGPHVKNVVAAMPPMLLRLWIADLGYIVVSVDGRGTPGRGRAFERALKEAAGHGSFGAVPLDDQIDALRALARDRPEMDLSRVGIYGWSFGGYLAALAVLRRPDVFKVAVAGAPVVDWRDYDTCYTERYLGMPDANKAGYDESSLLTYAKDLARPLLLIHGTTDDNVYFLHTLKLADALFRAGRDFELLPLQGFTHMVPDPLVRQRLYARILGALGRALLP